MNTAAPARIEHSTSQTFIENTPENITTEEQHSVAGTLTLTAPLTQRQVSFDEETVDNEHMNKKKSKICCIYKKPHDPNVSSDSDSSCEGNEYEHQPKYHKHKGHRY